MINLFHQAEHISSTRGSSVPLKVAVGTRNPVKVKAVHRVFSKYFQEVEVLKVEVTPSVPAQPIGFEETIRGAVERAREALVKAQADYGVGIEAGMLPMPYTLTGYVDQQFAAIADPSGTVTIGGGPCFEYPPLVVVKVLSEGIEVNEVMSRIAGVEDLGKKQGAIGFLSRGIMNRTELTEAAVLMALLPRINRDLYF